MTLWSSRLSTSKFKSLRLPFFGHTTMCPFESHYASLSCYWFLLNPLHWANCCPHSLLTGILGPFTDSPFTSQLTFASRISKHQKVREDKPELSRTDCGHFEKPLLFADGIWLFPRPPPLPSHTFHEDTGHEWERSTPNCQVFTCRSQLTAYITTQALETILNFAFYFLSTSFPVLMLRT